jgi:hypothetical protein
MCWPMTEEDNRVLLAWFRALADREARAKQDIEDEPPDGDRPIT